MTIVTATVTQSILFARLAPLLASVAPLLAGVAVTRRIAWKQLLGLAAIMAAGGVLGAAIAVAGVNVLPEARLGAGQKAVLLLSLPVLYMLAIAIHELGHLGGGMLAGFQSLLFIVGPLKVEWRPDGRRAGLNRSMLLAGGLVACAPRGVHDLRARTLVMVAGGPVISLMAGAQLLALWHVASPSLMQPGTAFAAHWLALALLIVGMSSLLIGLLTLLPARTGGFYSDGARMLRLLRAGEEAEKEVALLAVTGQAIGGTRPREWQPALVRQCATIRDGGPFEVGGRYYAFLHALDRGDVAEAREHAAFVSERIGQMPTGSRASLLLGIATFHALHDGDAERARELVGAARHSLVATPHQRELVNAAILLADDHIDEARRHAAQAIRLAADAIDRGSALLDISLAERILQRTAAAGD